MAINADTRIIEVVYSPTVDGPVPRQRIIRCLNGGMYACTVGILTGGYILIRGREEADSTMALSGLGVFAGSVGAALIIAIADQCLRWDFSNSPD